MEMTVNEVGGIRMYAVCLDDDSKLALPGAGRTTLFSEDDVIIKFALGNQTKVSAPKRYGKIKG